MGVWDAFEAFVGGQPEPPLQPVPGMRSGYLPPHDDDFVASLDPIAGTDIDGVALGIAYKDATGMPSQRTIRCKAAYRDRPGGRHIYIEAWCLLRQDWRSFRLDRIVDVYDYTTGEVVGSGEAFFGSLLGTDVSQPLSEAKACKQFVDGARVLTFIAMSDGRLDARELAIIVEFAVSRVRTVSPTYPNPEWLARMWVGNYVPSRQSALAGLRAVWADEVYAADVASRMIDVMLADGHVSDEEMEAAWAIVKGMNRADVRRAQTGI
jgi:hypothetical protein